MSIKKFFIKEFQTLGKYEKICFPLIIILICSISLYMKDNKIALLSAICGITYTILAGKGRIYCYIFGIISTLCYGYISWKNYLYGQLLLNIGYYLPMQIVGVFCWKNNLKKNSAEIYKTKLPISKSVKYYIITILISVGCYFVLKNVGDKQPLIDSITTVFSGLGMYFTVKRSIEQWYAWIVVNGLSVLMWVGAYINGSNCFATILMWLVYFVLGFYFLHSWQKEVS